MFMKKFLQSSPEASGDALLTMLCCNYWLVKSFAEPFLNSTKGVQVLVDTTSLCVSQSRARLNCNNIEEDDVHAVYDAEKSRYEDERKGRHASANYSLLMKICNGFALIASYIIIIVLMYASFTV